MNKFASAFRVLSVAAIAVAVGCLIGCETTDEWDTSLTVTPSSRTLQTYPSSVTFVVSGGTGSVGATGTTSEVTSATLGALSLPLTWSVSNPTLGGIVTSGGNQAIYTRARRDGINIITVRDQYGAEGYATVNQETLSTETGTGGSLDLVTDVANQTIPNGVTTCQISVAAGQGTAPFTWTVQEPNKGSIPAGSTGRQVTFTSAMQAGQNVQVTATDADGRSGSITIKQAVP